MKATAPNSSTRKLSEKRAIPVIPPVLERLGTRSQYTRLIDNLGEFTDVSDEDAATWVKYLLTRYKRCKYTPDYDDDFRQRLIRNTNAAIALAHTLHQNNQYGMSASERHASVIGILIEFVHTSDEDAYSWIRCVLEDYIGSKLIVKHSADFRQRLTRNVIAVIDLTRILHEHHKGGGLYKLAQRGI
jgi:hypothetical protein